MSKIKCILGFHKGPLIMKERTKEIDSVSGSYLTRNTHHCNSCSKTYHKRTDNIIGISNESQWNWVATDFYF
jgi:ribosomal protein L37AE/L43A